MKVLTIEEQISVLKSVREKLRKSENISGVFLCCLIRTELRLRYRFYEYFIEENMPSFNRGNAINLCRKHKISIPNDTTVWWNYDSGTSNIQDSLPTMKKARDKFLGVLIKDLSKQLK